MAYGVRWAVTRRREIGRGDRTNLYPTDPGRRSRQREMMLGSARAESQTHRTAGGRAAGNVQTRDGRTDVMSRYSGNAAESRDHCNDARSSWALEKADFGSSSVLRRPKWASGSRSAALSQSDNS